MQPFASLQHQLKARLHRALLQPVDALPLTPERVFRPHPIAVYAHVPFCGSTCHYCCFNKFRRPAAQIESYMEALAGEVQLYAERRELANVEVSSLYIGGGTPSHVPAEHIARLLDAIGHGFRARPDLQITLEANPESIAETKLERYVAAGINRISLGVQSFDEEQLRRLGRRHGQAQIRLALGRIQRAGIGEVNIDLMYGLPGQQLAELRTELHHAVSSGATHIALFPLSYQPGTDLWKGRHGRRPLRRMYELALDELSRAGFEQYTTEDFTRTVPCSYNVDAWTPPPTDCLGLGAGALSTFAGTNWHNLGNLDGYVAAVHAGRPPMAGGGAVSTRQQMIDHLLVATKTLSLDERAFEQRFGVGLTTALGPIVGCARALGLARRRDDGNPELTRLGRYVASRAWSEFILGKLARVAEESQPGRP